MYKIITIFMLLISTLPATTTTEKTKHNDIKSLYNDLGLSKYISLDLFRLSLTGYQNLLKNSQISDSTKLTIIDFSKSSNEKRFFVVDLKNRRLLFASLVAHGKNSGNLYAKDFSNTNGSLKSSLGFYITSGTYYGKHGYSLKLKGQEEGFNHQAEKRAIVMHGAKYVSEDFIKKHGRLGRSWGCPALPLNLTKSVINEIKDGTCLFIFSDNEKYLQSSLLLNNI